MSNLKRTEFFRKLPLIICAILLCTVSINTANAQDARASIDIGDLPPIMLEEGNVVDLFATFRDNQTSIVFKLESKAKVVPVSFQTVVKHNGETIGRSTRKPMPYFPGEMIMCPESFDFISLLYEASNEKELLSEGEYQVGIIVLSKEGRALGEEANFEFSVP